MSSKKRALQSKVSEFRDGGAEPPRDQSMTIRLTTQEEDQIHRAAILCGMTFSGYVREVVLGHQPKARPGVLDENGVAELTRPAAGVRAPARAGCRP